MKKPSPPIGHQAESLIKRIHSIYVKAESINAKPNIANLMHRLFEGDGQPGYDLPHLSSLSELEDFGDHQRSPITLEGQEVGTVRVQGLDTRLMRPKGLRISVTICKWEGPIPEDLYNDKDMKNAKVKSEQEALEFINRSIAELWPGESVTLGESKLEEAQDWDTRDQDGAKNTDPTKEEMLACLRENDMITDREDTDDAEVAMYYFASAHHGGQASNLYKASSTSSFKPSSQGSLEGETLEVREMYAALEHDFAGDQGWHESTDAAVHNLLEGRSTRRLSPQEAMKLINAGKWKKVSWSDGVAGYPIAWGVSHAKSIDYDEENQQMTISWGVPRGTPGDQRWIEIENKA